MPTSALLIEGNTIRTDNPGWPKVGLHCFSSRPLNLEFDPKSHDLAHKDNLEIRDAENEWKSSRPELREQMAFVRRTLVKWSGQGDQLLVTLITTEPWQVRGDKDGVHRHRTRRRDDPLRRQHAINHAPSERRHGGSRHAVAGRTENRRAARHPARREQRRIHATRGRS